MQFTDPIMITLDEAKNISPKGVEYWMGRLVQEILGYATWENFETAIKRAMAACESSGRETKYHFRETTKMIDIGKGGQRKTTDYFLDRFACYLIAMNGDPSKPEIAAAQTYFAVNTRLQELGDKALENDEIRLHLRERVRDANKHLNSAAKQAGVQNYAFFHDAGYQGLYGMRLSAIKEKKKLNKKDDLLDHSGRAELAANEFRITQTEEALVREKIVGESEAKAKHHKIGQEVRATIERLGGTMPENLPPEPSIKKLVSKRVKEIESEDHAVSTVETAPSVKPKL